MHILLALLSEHWCALKSIYLDFEEMHSFSFCLYSNVTIMCVCVCCQHGKQLHCNYQLSKLVPKKLEGTNLTEHKVSCLYIVCRHRVSLTSDQLHIHLYICVCV